MSLQALAHSRPPGLFPLLRNVREEITLTQLSPIPLHCQAQLPLRRSYSLWLPSGKLESEGIILLFQGLGE